MKVVIDSYELLSAIGRHRDTFIGINTLVTKQATALLTAQFKHKSLDLQAFRATVAAIGAEAFELYLDTADLKLLKPIVKRLDQHAPVMKSDDDDALRGHLLELAAQRIEPTPKPSKTSMGSKKIASQSAASDATEPSKPHAIATKPPGRR